MTFSGSYFAKYASLNRLLNFKLLTKEVFSLEKWCEFEEGAYV